jgi:hypothetical protein
MFSKHHRFTRLAGVVAAAAILVPVAQAGAQAPRAMPSDSAAQEGVLPRAMPSDYAAYYASQIEPGDYGMPRALPADYEPVGGTSGGRGFDWADAGIGAGAAFGLVLLAAAGAAAVRRRGQLAQT